MHVVLAQDLSFCIEEPHPNIQEDFEAQNYIQNGLSEKYQVKVSHLPNAFHMWNELTVIFTTMSILTYKS